MAAAAAGQRRPAAGTCRCTALYEDLARTSLTGGSYLLLILVTHIQPTAQWMQAHLGRME